MKVIGKGEQAERDDQQAMGDNGLVLNPDADEDSQQQIDKNKN